MLKILTRFFRVFVVQKMIHSSLLSSIKSLVVSKAAAFVIRTRNYGAPAPVSRINDYILIMVDNKLLRRLRVVIRETDCAYAKLMCSFCFMPVSLECASDARVWPYASLLHLLAYVPLAKQDIVRVFTCFLAFLSIYFHFYYLPVSRNRISSLSRLLRSITSICEHSARFRKTLDPLDIFKKRHNGKSVINRQKFSFEWF